MKNVPWIIWVVFLIFAGTGWGLWIHDKLVNPEIQSATITQPPTPHPTSMPLPPNFTARMPSTVTMQRPNIWDEYMVARHKILQENSDLASEYKELQDEFSAHREKLDAAMIRADPNAASIIAKLAAFHQRRMDAPGAQGQNQSSQNPGPSQ